MSDFKQEFIEIDLNNLIEEVKARKEHDWRYVQTLAVKTDKGTDLIYSFMKHSNLDNVKIVAVKDTDSVKSITDYYIEAFVWENEIHDLFGVSFSDIAIDFNGSFYNLSEENPMSKISKEAINRKEKQAKINAAIASKKAKNINNSSINAKKSTNRDSEDKKGEVE